MGRTFTTVYHFLLVSISISALVLSILSATSCQFLTFDHQYKGTGRFLYGLEITRSLQTGAAAAGADAATEDALVSGAASSTPEDLAAKMTTAEKDALMAAEQEAQEALELVSGAASSTAEGLAEKMPTAEKDALMAAEQEALEELAAKTAAAGGAAEETAAVTETVATAAAIPVAEVTATVITPTVTAPAPAPKPYPKSPTAPTSFNLTPASPTAMKEAAGYVDAYTDNKSVVVATASGDAGLYCDGEKKFSVTNLWKGTIQDLEQEIVSESDKNQSEELARNAVLAATVFASVITFIVVMEGLFGWRVWFERWILGLAAIMACISQGITFLFFNSQRYCDGDIINEILNQEPCVMGKGGVFSLVATILFGIIIVMACAGPKNNPYGICRRGSDEPTTTGNNSNGDLTGGKSSKFRFLGGGSKSTPLGQDDNSFVDGKPEKPGWLSEDRDRTEDEVI